MLERGKMERGIYEIVDSESLVPAEHLPNLFLTRTWLTENGGNFQSHRKSTRQETDFTKDRIKGRKFNKVKCDIQSHIIAAGYIQKEAVEACSTEYGWSDSDSNFSAKLSDQTLRYRKVLELADVLGYEIVWQKRRDV